MADENQNRSRAIVLVSGGLDSATVLAMAKAQGFDCYAMSFDYGQRHRAELVAAEQISSAAEVVEYKTIKLDLSAIGGSALTDSAIDVPDHQPARSGEIPVTYVPARNTVFLAIALAWAEVVQATEIFIGVNAVDYSGYPDCRPEFISAFEQMASLATKAAVQGQRIHINTPLIHLTKREIISQGLTLGVDYSLTVSCYQANAQGEACGHCDSCYLRKQGFREAGVDDPTRYSRKS